MKSEKMGDRHRLRWFFLYFAVFLVVFVLSALFKLTYQPQGDAYAVDWDASVGTAHLDLPYGEQPANRFDLYVPADGTRARYGLVVYLHAGGFTSGDKQDDAPLLQWLCSKGYVAAGINYTLFSEENPEANIYTQSVEIRQSIPYVLAAAAELGYPIDQMAVGGGSAGGCLALLYAYRDAKTAPVPVQMVFEAVGPSSFYPEDWSCFGLDQSAEAAAALFGVMAGRQLSPDLFGTPAYDEAVRDISPLLWIDENSPPTVCAYGAYDKMQSFDASRRLDAALTENGVPHAYIVCEHSGHGLQNDSAQAMEYIQKCSEYLNTYLPV